MAFERRQNFCMCDAVAIDERRRNSIRISQVTSALFNWPLKLLQLAFAFALVFGFWLIWPVAQSLRLPLPALSVFLFALLVPKVHEYPAKCEADGTAGDQKNNARGFHQNLAN